MASGSLRTGGDSENSKPAQSVSFLWMDSYIRGGSYVRESASEPAIRATGLGTWRHAGGRNFTAVYQFFTYAPDGTPTGKLKVSARIRLSADGKSFPYVRHLRGV